MRRTNSITFLYRDSPDANRDKAWRAEQQSRRHRAPWRAAARRRRAAQTPLLRAFTSDLTADRKDQGMRVLRSTAVILALIMMSAPRAASAQTQPAAIAPEHQWRRRGRRKGKESTIVRSRPPTNTSCRAIAPNSSSIVWMARPNEISRPSSRRSTRSWPPKERRKKKKWTIASDRPANKKFYPVIGRNSSSTAWTNSAANMTTDKRGAS